MLRHLPVLLTLLALAGCSTVSLDYPADFKSRAQYDSGTPYVTQRKPPLLLDVGVPTERQSPGEPLPLIVTVGNLSKTPFNFGPENMTATCSGKPVRIYTFEELKAREEHQANMLALAAALNGASQAMNASLPRTTYGSGNLYGSSSPSYGGVGGYNYSGTYSGYSTTYDPAASSLAQSAIQANTSSRMSDIAATRNSHIAALRSNTFRTTTILPGKTGTGLIYFKLPSTMNKEKLITFTVHAAGQSLSFPVIYK